MVTIDELSQDLQKKLLKLFNGNATFLLKNKVTDPIQVRMIGEGNNREYSSLLELAIHSSTYPNATDCFTEQNLVTILNASVFDDDKTPNASNASNALNKVFATLFMIDSPFLPKITAALLQRKGSPFHPPMPSTPEEPYFELFRSAFGFSPDCRSSDASGQLANEEQALKRYCAQDGTVGRKPHFDFFLRYALEYPQKSSSEASSKADLDDSCADRFSNLSVAKYSKETLKILGRYAAALPSIRETLARAAKLERLESDREAEKYRFQVRSCLQDEMDALDREIAPLQKKLELQTKLKGQISDISLENYLSMQTFTSIDAACPKTTPTSAAGTTFAVAAESSSDLYPVDKILELEAEALSSLIGPLQRKIAALTARRREISQFLERMKPESAGAMATAAAVAVATGVAAATAAAAGGGAPILPMHTMATARIDVGAAAAAPPPPTISAVESAKP